jgi:murein L,D-transpeptidase YcbB/YkuD
MTSFGSFPRLSRRELTLGFLLAGVSASSATAQSLIGGQAEWRQSYDAVTSLSVARSSTSVLSPMTTASTEQMIEKYRQIVAQGGWPAMPKTTLRLGQKGPAVVALRKRLMASGDLDPSAGLAPVFDSFVEAAVKRFQERHGLIPTGVLTAQTIAAMNIPADVRLRQLETNLVRLRSYGNLPNRFVVANIPAATVETVEAGVVATRHAAGVGKMDRQSPIMTTRVVDINFNPFWTVPASIIRKDLIPKMQADPNYLTENKIRIYNQQGQELQPRQVNWRSDEATRYMFRQDPGGDFNSLGVVRINIPNPHGVYMHDTPSKGIFGDDFRFVSSGCMRVQNVRDYITWLLKDTPGWDRQRIDEAIQSGNRVDARLSQPVPVYWVYITAWATPDGLVQFRDDIYQKDGLGPVPVASMAVSNDDTQ